MTPPKPPRKRPRPAKRRSRRRPHLLVVAGGAGAEAFRPLVEAIAGDGIEPRRVGWLDWSPAAPDQAAPDELRRAVGAGTLRAVRVGAGGSVAVKGRVGPPLLDDVLREHFRGCRLVLVRGEGVDAPEIRPAGEGRYAVGPDGASRVFDAVDLASRLRRPRLDDQAERAAVG